jgi:hypothetical protein
MKGLEILGWKGNNVHWKLDGIPGHSMIEDGRIVDGQRISGRVLSAVSDCEHYLIIHTTALTIMRAVADWFKNTHPARVDKARQLLIIDGLNRLVEVPEDAASYVDEGGCVWVQCWYSIGDEVCED